MYEPYVWIGFLHHRDRADYDFDPDYYPPIIYASREAAVIAIQKEIQGSDPACWDEGYSVPEDVASMNFGSLREWVVEASNDRYRVILRRLPVEGELV